MQATIMQNVAGIRPIHMVKGRMSSSTFSVLPSRIFPAFPLNKVSIISNPSNRLHRTNALDPTSLVDTVTTTTQAVYELAGIDSSTASTLNLILRPVLSIASLLMIVRIVLTWYPEVDGDSMPWLIAVKPTGRLLFAFNYSYLTIFKFTFQRYSSHCAIDILFLRTEPLLAATRKVVKPFNGLDVSPIVWVALLSFLSEILTGPQGILSLIERKGI